MWALEVPVVDKVLRAAAVCFFLLTAMRSTGERQLGLMSSFDIVVLLMISNIVSNARIGKRLLGHRRLHRSGDDQLAVVDEQRRRAILHAGTGQVN
jgi:hypothetical protein